MPVSSLRTLACLFVCALVCLSASASVLADKVVTSADGQLGCEFKSSGGSGSVVVLGNQTRGDSDAKLRRSFEIRWGKIEEQDPSGNKVKDASGYAVDAALWQGPTAVTLNNVPAQRIRLNNTLDVNGGTSATVALTAYVFSNGGTVYNGADALSVPSNSLKITIGIANWPFKSQNNNLTFSIELKLDTTSSGQSVREESLDNGRQQRLDWGGAALDLASSALVDGVLVPISYELEQNSAKTTIVFSFPAFNNDVVYDPTVSFESTSAAAKLGVGSILVALLAAAVALLKL